MKPVPLALGVLTAAAFAGCIGLSIYAEMPLQYLPGLFFDAELITKLADMLLMAMVVMAIVLPRGSAKGGGLLTIWAGLSVGLGLLITLLNASFTWRAMQATGPMDLKVIAPGLAEGLLPLALGLLAAAIATARAGRKA